MSRSPRRRSPRHLLLALVAGLLVSLGGLGGGMAVAPASADAAQLRELYDYYFTTTYRACSARCARFPARGGARQAERELRSCFNCTFPVDGAPRAYPRNGQYIPLKACLTLFCKDAPVRFNEVRGNGWFGLDAQPGHFDGAGSKIYFRFYKQPSTGYLRLRVRALVADPSIPDVINKQVAKYTWKAFATSMGSAVHG